MSDTTSDATIQPDSAPLKREFYVVGIGASAGGLEALEIFFDNMPPLADFAFVVVQHLSPDYKSLMGELLRKHTQLSIHEAEDGITVEPGNIYLMPRKKNMTMYHGRLFLTEKEHGLNLPIDIFFQSLAEDRGEKAIGIILSGTGSDGTRGIRSIKEVGGMVMVQAEDSAKFDGMPRSAISTGIVDYVLPVAQLPEELQNFTSGKILIRTPDTPSNGEGYLQKIFMLIKRKTGVDLSYYKENTIIRRIERRMGINHVHHVKDYVQLLEESPAEISILFKEILIGVTRFFRDAEAFEVIKQQIISEIINSKEAGQPIRIWVAGCSTGEEAYGLAILFDQYCQDNYLNNDLKVFATDIDKDAIEFASHGAYPESIAADAPTAILQKYFVKKGERYQVVPRIREMVVFAYHNIFKDPPFRSIDLISCRNLLIYLQPVLQKRVISNFQFSLKKEGFLFLGSSETIGESSKYFKNIDVKWKIFRYKGGFKPRGMATIAPDPAFRGTEQAAEPSPEARAQIELHPPKRGVDAIYERLIETSLPPCVLVNEQREVHHIFGDINAYLKLPLGKMNLDVLKMAREDIQIPLGTALPRVIKERKEIEFSDIVVGEDADAHQITLTIRPISDAHGNSYFAVIFQPQKTAQNTTSGPVKFNVDESVQRRIQDLETELQYTKENLQATIEELETSNEELQATNEELLSSNEELQSTNEELQSVNEELITVNTEYQKKIEELSELNNDMNNLLSSTDIGTVFLDTSFHIRKYTQPVTRQINIIKTDLGRPISHLSHNLIYETLMTDIETVARTQQQREVEIQNRSGNWLLVRITPYLSDGSTVNGIVISIIDISERKNIALALQRQHDLMMRVLEASPSGITMVDQRGKIVFANKRGEELLGMSRNALSEMSYNDAGFRISDLEGNEIASEDLPFAQVMRTGKPVLDYEQCVTQPDGLRVALRIHGNPIYDERNTVEGVVFNLEELGSGNCPPPNHDSETPEGA